VSAAGLPALWDSRRLWSLWDMLESYALDFFYLSHFIEWARNLLESERDEASRAPARMVSLKLIGNELAPFDKSQPPLSEWLGEGEKNRITQILKMVNNSCKNIAIFSVDKEIKRIISLIIHAKRNDVIIHIEYLRDRLIDELENALFLHVSTEHSKYYRKADLFGAEVSKKLPKLSEDISNAGTCFSLGLNTACVFHLMRVMEYCVQRLGTKLKISLNPQANSWYQIMEQVNAQIKAMPGGKNATKAQNTRKQNFGLAAGRLDHVRIVWRNDVMHPKDTYDAPEALEVLTGVNAFVNSIVRLV
jgi:hypothetical protein